MNYAQITVDNAFVKNGPHKGSTFNHCRLTFDGTPPGGDPCFVNIIFKDCAVDIAVPAFAQWCRDCVFENCSFVELALGVVELGMPPIDDPPCEFRNCDFSGAEIWIRLGKNRAKYVDCHASYIWTLDGLQINDVRGEGFVVAKDRNLNAIMDEIVSHACASFEKADDVTQQALHNAYESVTGTLSLIEGDNYPECLYPSLNPPVGWEDLIAEHFKSTADDNNEPVQD